MSVWIELSKDEKSMKCEKEYILVHLLCSGDRYPRLIAPPPGWSAQDVFWPRKYLKGECEDVFGKYSNFLEKQIPLWQVLQ